MAKEALRNRYDGAILHDVIDNGVEGEYWTASDVYVVFDPVDIKSTHHNIGTFSPDDPSILASGGVEGDIAEMAKGYSSFDDFATAYNEATPLAEGEALESRESTLRKAWSASHPEKGTFSSAEKANADFIADLSADDKEGLKHFLKTVGALLSIDRKKVRKTLDPIEVAAMRYADGKALSPEGLETVLATIAANPEKYRDKFARLMMDKGMLAQLQAERAGQAPVEEPTFESPLGQIPLKNVLSRLKAAAAELDDEELRELYEDGRISYGQIIADADTVASEVQRLKGQVDLANQTLLDWRASFMPGEQRISAKVKAQILKVTEKI